MATDLIKRLRQHALPDPHDEREVLHAPLLRESADALEQVGPKIAELMAENKQLRDDVTFHIEREAAAILRIGRLITQKTITWDELESKMRGLYQCSIVDGEKRITLKGLRVSRIIAEGSGERHQQIRSRAFCSCCGSPVSAIRQWETLQICDTCWDDSTPQYNVGQKMISKLEE